MIERLAPLSMPTRMAGIAPEGILAASGVHRNLTTRSAFWLVDRDGCWVIEARG
jgi:hypothetical protein